MQLPSALPRWQDDKRQAMDLSIWWRRVRPRCAPLGTTEPLPPDALRRRLSAGLGWAAGLAGTSDINRRLVLPELFCSYLQTLGPTVWIGHRIALDFIFRTAQQIAEQVEREDPDDYEPAVVREAGLWIPFADVGDKHTWFLCCDGERPEVGQVADAHDDHPWLNGTRYLSSLQPFASWLLEVEQTSKTTPGGLLVALSSEEYRALDALRDTPDPWQRAIALRDLQYRVTPDDAWSHAAGAPDRVAWLHVAPQPACLAEFVFHRDEELLAALIPAEQLASALGPLPAYELGAWDARRRFSFVADPPARIRQIAGAAQSSGWCLYLGDVVPASDA